MRYALLIIGSPTAAAALSADGRARLEAGHREFVAALDTAGVPVSFSAELGEVTGARTVRSGSGGIVTDGPFAEAKEQIGGLYVIDVPTLDDAVAWARRLPEAAPEGVLPGAIEVRAVR